MRTQAILPVPHSEGQAVGLMGQDLAKVKDYLLQSRSENTRRAQVVDWSDFERYCEATGQQALPATPAAVCGYLAHLAERGLKLATINRRLSTISTMHRLRAPEEANPTKAGVVRATLRGIARTHGRPQERKAAAQRGTLRRLLAQIPKTPQGARDRALILLGWAGALRRSELTALNVEDIRFFAHGMRVLLRRSKTDQEGQGYTLTIPNAQKKSLCAVRALRRWLKVSGIKEGALFRGLYFGGKVRSERLDSGSVARIVKKYAKAAGLDPKQFGGHSLRAGFVTAMVRAGVEERHIMKHSRHKSLAVFRTYIRAAREIEDNPLRLAGW